MMLWLKAKVKFIELQRVIGYWLIKRRNNAQVSIKITKTFTKASWEESALPTMGGMSRVYADFVPERAFLSESLIVTYSAEGKKCIRRATFMHVSSDLVLTSAFIDGDSCFPELRGG